MRLLALDLALRTGWAFGGEPSSVPPEWGTFDLPAEAPGEIGRRLWAFQGWLSDKVVDLQPDQVAIESPVLRGAGGWRARLLIGMAGAAEAICWAHSVTITEAHSNTVRKHFCGHGRPGKTSDEIKRAVMRCCQARGWAAVDHNAADALALWDYVHSLYDPALAARTGPLFQGAA